MSFRVKNRKSAVDATRAPHHGEDNDPNGYAEIASMLFLHDTAPALAKQLALLDFSRTKHYCG